MEGKKIDEFFKIFFSLYDERYRYIYITDR